MRVSREEEDDYRTEQNKADRNNRANMESCETMIKTNDVEGMYNKTTSP